MTTTSSAQTNQTLVLSGIVELAASSGSLDQCARFGVLSFRPEWKDRRVYQAAVAGSFAAVTWGHVGLAVLAAKRRWKR